MEENVAKPHFLESVVSNLKKNVFGALIDNLLWKREYREKKRQSFEYYRFSLMNKALETLKWISEVNRERKNKVEFIQTQRNDRYLRIVFD
jgi:hypothetical protein